MEYPIEDLIHYIEDFRRDMDWASDDFASGYDQALHGLYEHYLIHEQDPCCEYMFPEALQNGEWVCAECDTVLVEEDEEVVPR